MIFKQFYLNCLAHASYLIGDERSRSAAVVDPQRDIDQYVPFAADHGPGTDGSAALILDVPRAARAGAEAHRRLRSPPAESSRGAAPGSAARSTAGCVLRGRLPFVDRRQTASAAWPPCPSNRARPEGKAEGAAHSHNLKSAVSVWHGNTAGRCTLLHLVTRPKTQPFQSVGG
jgi:hypothetical protein